MTFGRRLWPASAILLAFVLVLGIVLFLAGGDSSKWAALGTTLIGSAVVGAVLIALERGLAARSVEIERKVSLAAAPEPARDTEGSEARR